MENTIQIKIKNNISELPVINGVVEELGESHNVSPNVIFDLNLIFEEFITNIIKYGYSDKSEHIITVSISISGNTMRASIEDDGIDFNPLQAPEPDVDIPLEERKIGGLGIFLIRKLTERLDYERKNNKNIISFIKKIS